MTRLFSQFEPHGPMTQVRAGMAVYDQEEKRVGTVTEIHMGDGTDTGLGGVAAATPGEAPERPHTILEDLGAALGDRDSLPEAARDHLLRVGYIAIDAAGIFAGERFATADQVASVEDDRVVLNVASDVLIRG
jgi:hypothetical protein